MILRFSKDGDTRGAGFRWEEGAPLSSLGQYAKGDRPGNDLKSDKEGGREEEQRDEMIRKTKQDSDTVTGLRDKCVPKPQPQP